MRCMRRSIFFLALALGVSSALLTLPRVTQAAVTVDAAGPSTGTTCSNCRTINWSHTVSGSNTLLVVGVGLGDSPDTSGNITVTYDGVSMTSAGIRHSGDLTAGYVQMFYLVAPHSGTHTVSVDAGYTGAGGQTLIGGSISFDGVSQSTPVRNITTNATGGGGAASISVSVTSATGNMVVDAAVTGTSFTSSGQTSQWLKNLSSGTGASNAAQSTAAGATSVNMSYVISTDVAAIVAMDIVAAPVVTKFSFTRPPNNLGLVGYWSFNEGTGTKAEDFSGSGNTGTLTTTVSTLPQWTNGRFGSALTFDGSTDYVPVDSVSSSLHTGPIAVSLWFKPNVTITSASAAATLFTLGDQTSTNDFSLNFNQCISSDGKLSLCYDPGGTTAQFEASPTSWAAGVWHHAVATYDGTTYALYVDGALASSGNDTRTGLTFSTHAAIGSIDHPSPTSFFNGVIDDVRVYNRGLSATDVANLYQKSGLARLAASTAILQHGSTLESGLAGYWTFDGPDFVNSGVVDRSGNSNTGYIAGFATSSAMAIGKLGQAAHIPSSVGNADKFRVDNSSSINFSYTFSVAFWFKGTAATTFNGFFGKDVIPGWLINNGSGVDQTSMYLRLDSATTSNMTGATITGVLDGNWHHIVYVVNHGSMTGYKDGVQAATGSYSDADLSNTAPFEVSSTGVDQYIDDVRLYNRVLSATEVKQLYNLGTAKIKQN